MAKFKVGDKVRVRCDLTGKLYYMEDKVTDCLFAGGMDRYSGKVVTIAGIDAKRYYIKEDNSMFHWVDGMFSGLATDQPRREFIVIRRSGAETIAELRHDREVIKSAVATCSEKDTFDFETGAKLAFDRLMGREEAKKKPYIEREFKIGDRVITSHGVGEVVDVDHNETSMPYQIMYDKGYKYWSYSGTAKPAPHPAHRFKVGDRVETPVGIGVIDTDDGSSVPYRIYYENNPTYGNFHGWEQAIDISPAPEPPKYYTGKVKLVKSCGCYECEHIVGEEFAISNGYVVSNYGAWGQPFTSFADFVSKRHNKAWVEVTD